MKKYHYNKVTIIQGSQIVKGIILTIVLLLFVFSLSGLLTTANQKIRISSQTVNDATSVFTGKMLFSLLSFENQYFPASIKKEEKPEALGKQLLKLSANISLDDPRSLLGKELPGFSIFDTEILVAGDGTDYTNMPFESPPPNDSLEMDKNVQLQNTDDVDAKDEKPGTSDPIIKSDKKEVFIYSSHNTESYLPYLKNVAGSNRAYHPEVNVTKLGEKLQKNLDTKGIGSVLNSVDIHANLVKKGLKFGRSYQESRSVVEAAIANNKDFKYLIDIHRDALRKNKTTKVMNGTSYAKISFVVGGKNAKYQKNVAFAKKLHDEIQKKYPGLSKGIFLKKDAGSNGVYNQDLSDKAILIEVGGVDNTFEEMYRTIDIFSDAFNTVFWSEKDSNAVNAN